MIRCNGRQPLSKALRGFSTHLPGGTDLGLEKGTSGFDPKF